MTFLLYIIECLYCTGVRYHLYGDSIMRRSGKSGLEPGTPVYVGEQRTDRVIIDAMCFNAHDLSEHVNMDIGELGGLRDSSDIVWVNVIGVHDVEILRTIGEYFDIHPLTIEDIANTDQRPKFEDYPGYLFCVLNMIQYDKDVQELALEHLSLVVGEHFIISFQEEKGDVFDGVRDRLRQNRGKLRSSGSDLCMYALMDAIVDGYFVALETLGDGIDACEDNLFVDIEKVDLAQVHGYKREVLDFRKTVWPLRDELSMLERTESGLITKETRVYLRDVHDHVIQVIDMIDSYINILSSIHDTYLSLSSNRMNEIMKVLTTIATIFNPLTFIVGVYGMNFDNMPELHWAYGYAVVWFVMIAVAAGLVVVFKKSKWL